MAKRGGMRHRYLDPITQSRKVGGALDEYYGDGRPDRSFEDNVLAKYERAEDLQPQAGDDKDDGISMLVPVIWLYLVGVLGLVFWLT